MDKFLEFYDVEPDAKRQPGQWSGVLAPSTHFIQLCHRDLQATCAFVTLVGLLTPKTQMMTKAGQRFALDGSMRKS